MKGIEILKKKDIQLTMINHDIVWFHIAMHNPIRMAEIQSFEKLVHVVSNIEIRKKRVENLEVNIVHMFED